LDELNFQYILWQLNRQYCESHGTVIKIIWYCTCLISVFRESSISPTSAGCQVPWWQLQLDCEWDATPQNCEADAQSTEPVWFWKCCTAYFFQLGYQ